jgi:hypothetical protein
MCQYFCFPVQSFYRVVSQVIIALFVPVKTSLPGIIYVSRSSLIPRWAGRRFLGAYRYS